MKTDNHVVALVVARPGRLRDGWRALLLATGPIEHVSLADDTSMAMCMAGALNPKLVLVDVEAFGDEARNLLAQIKAQQPTCCCVALTRDTRQAEEWQSAGADTALVKGFPAAVLFDTVGRLLPQADWQLERVKENVTDRLDNTWSDGGPGCGGRHGGMMGVPGMGDF